MRRCLRLFFGFFALLISGMWLTDACVEPAHATDAAAGKEKAEVCAGCHGENGVSQTENIPSLAAQQDQFTQWQLVFFRGGARKNDQMQPIAQDISRARRLSARLVRIIGTRAPRTIPAASALPFA